jgi:YHS domain-containing protein
MIRQLSLTTNQAILITVVALAVIMFSNTGMAFDEINTTSLGVAIKGYDTVAYHFEGRAVKGKSEFSHEWNDAKWYFSSAHNMALFATDPERFAPQYGGY